MSAPKAPIAGDCHPAPAAAGGAAVAVIIPTCGRPHLLARALSSVVAQSFRAWECVVVNDLPAARTSVETLLLRFGDARIRARHNAANQGAAAARNAGIACTTAPYLAFLDDDDYWLPDHLQGIMAVHDASPEPAVIYTDYIQRWEGDLVAPRLTAAKSPPEDATRALLAGAYNILTMSTVSLPKRCAVELGAFDPRLKTGQDWDFYVRASAHYPFIHLNQYSVVYFHHFQSRLTLDYALRRKSLDLIIQKWRLDDEFLQNKMKHWKYMALDAMLLAASTKDRRAQYRALKYFFALPAPFAAPAVLAKLLVMAILPYRLYAAIVCWWHREREEAARGMLDAMSGPEFGKTASWRSDR